MGSPKKVLMLVAVVAVAGGAGYLAGSASSPAPAARVGKTTRIITVSMASADQTVAATGTIAPAGVANPQFAVSGTVNQVLVGVGQNVSAGQPVATLDQAPFSAALAQAQATLTADQSKLAADQAQGVSSQVIAADQAAINADQASVSVAQANLAATTLTSPISGVVGAINVASGQQVTAGGSASPVATIFTPSSWVVDASVSDAEIVLVAKGDPVTITPQGFNAAGHGTVSSVGLLANSSGGVTTFPVSIQVSGNPSGFYAGVPANLSIVTHVNAGAMVIPVLAVHHPTSSKPFVVLATAGGPHRQSVTLGSLAGANVVVTGGLRPGERVVERVPNLPGGLTSNRAGRGAGRSGAGKKHGGGLAVP